MEARSLTRAELHMGTVKLTKKFNGTQAPYIFIYHNINSSIQLWQFHSLSRMWRIYLQMYMSQREFISSKNTLPSVVQKICKLFSKWLFNLLHTGTINRLQHQQWNPSPNYCTSRYFTAVPILVFVNKLLHA